MCVVYGDGGVKGYVFEIFEYKVKKNRQKNVRFVMCFEKILLPTFFQNLITRRKKKYHKKTSKILLNKSRLQLFLYKTKILYIKF